MNISFPLLLRGEGVFFFMKRMLENRASSLTIEGIPLIVLRLNIEIKRDLYGN